MTTHQLSNWGKMGFTGEALLQEPFIQVCEGSLVRVW